MVSHSSQTLLMRQVKRMPPADLHFFLSYSYLIINVQNACQKFIAQQLFSFPRYRHPDFRPRGAEVRIAYSRRLSFQHSRLCSVVTVCAQTVVGFETRDYNRSSVADRGRSLEPNIKADARASTNTNKNLDKRFRVMNINGRTKEIQKEEWSSSASAATII